MAEWSKAQHWKCCIGATLSWVQIPLSPPFLCSKTGVLPHFCPIFSQKASSEWHSLSWHRKKERSVVMVSLQNKRKYKRMSTLQGKLRRRSKGGQFSYRLIIASGLRKEFALGTTDPKVACQKAEELDSIWLAPTPDVALAQMNAIRGFSRSSMKLPFAEAWDKYQVHPERATPHTVSEQRAYRITFDEFVRFATEEYSINRNAKRPVTSISEVTPHLCEAFAAYLKTTMLAVDTHNRKIKRLRKIFECLKMLTPPGTPRARWGARLKILGSNLFLLSVACQIPSSSFSVLLMNHPPAPSWSWWGRMKCVLAIFSGLRRKP